uniref:RIN4 pathogenic type III effector avirulence factor Avr cleavage site domain-containing protein n=1 Tax=Oryza punctata TaxID=4537 RepID=A0A0E0LYU0_ORYPU
MAAEKGSPLPKFGEWDVNDPASAEGFTVIFNKARDEKKTGGNSQGQDLPAKSEQPSGQGLRNGSAACNLLLLNLEDDGLIGLWKRLPC